MVATFGHQSSLEEYGRMTCALAVALNLCFIAEGSSLFYNLARKPPKTVSQMSLACAVPDCNVIETTDGSLRFLRLSFFST